MYLNSLNLANFRNYEKLKLKFNKSKTIIVGQNAQGKTNLIEAIYFLATLSSSRVSSDAEFVMWEQPHSFINAEVTHGSGVLSELDVVITPGKSKILKLNKINKKSYKDFLGQLIAVSFSSIDLLLLRGTPSDRRKWIDTSICQLYPAYYDKLQTYNKIKDQKKAFLKTFNGYSTNLSSFQVNMLDSWNEQIAIAGSNIIYLRQKYLKEIFPFAKDKCFQISGENDSLNINYESSLGLNFNTENPNLPAIEEVRMIYTKQIENRTEEEIIKAQVLLGPHRDDISFNLNGMSAKMFASQGQQRTIVLSLKLAELDLIKASLGEEPVLLLDDVLAELDVLRQKYLFDSISSENQTIITTTDLDSFENDWLEDVEILNIKKGKIVYE